MRSSPRSPAAPKRRTRLAWAPALLLIATAVVFAPVLFADFVRLDDYSHLFDNPHLRRMSPAGLAAIWTHSYFSLYIPITYSVWWAASLMSTLFGPLRQAAWLFHASNLAVHLANATLVFFLLRRWVRLAVVGQDEVSAVKVALFGALCFALHPAQVETVAWISELKGGLATTLGLLGLAWHYRSPRRPVLAAATFVAAMLAKPTAIVFPGVVLVVDRVLLGASLRRSALLPALYGLLMLPLVLVTKQLQPDSELDFVPTLAQRLLVAGDALTFYVAKLLAPVALAVDYGRSPQFVLGHAGAWQLGLSALLLVAGIAAAVVALLRARPSTPQRAWKSLIACGWCAFFLALAPVLGWIPFGFQKFSTVADRYLYVPWLGGSLMVAGLLVRFAGSAHARRIAVAVLALFAVLSFRQATLWRSTVSLFEHTVKVNPRSYLGYYCIADEYMHAGRYDESIAWITRALAVNPDYLSAEMSLGLAWSQKGEYDKAVAQYEAVLSKQRSTVGTRAKTVSSIHNNLGTALLRVGREAEAVEHFRQAVAIFPRSLNAHLNLGNLAFDHGRFAEAIAEYEIARGLNLGSAAVEQRLARARQAAAQKGF